MYPCDSEIPKRTKLMNVVTSIAPRFLSDARTKLSNWMRVTMGELREGFVAFSLRSHAYMLPRYRRIITLSSSSNLRTSSVNMETGADSGRCPALHKRYTSTRPILGRIQRPLNRPLFQPVLEWSMSTKKTLWENRLYPVLKPQNQ